MIKRFSHNYKANHPHRGGQPGAGDTAGDACLKLRSGAGGTSVRGRLYAGHARGEQRCGGGGDNQNGENDMGHNVRSLRLGMVRGLQT